MSGQNHFPALAVAVWMMAGSIVTEANASGGRGGENMGRLLKGLNLTTGQKHRTEGIVKGHRSDLLIGKMEVLQARKNLLTVMSNNRSDEKIVHAAYGTLSAAEERLTVLQTKILNEVMPVLTPDQLVTIRNKIAKKSSRMQRSMDKLRTKIEYTTFERQTIQSSMK